MEKTNNTIGDDILYRYLIGGTTPQEEEEIYDWLNESEDNRSYFFDLKAVWNARNVLIDSRTLSRYAEMSSKLNTRIDHTERKPLRRRRFIRIMVSSVSAAAIVIAAVLVWSNIRNPQKEFITFQNTTGEIESITLEDGTQVLLNNNSTLMFAKSHRNGERIAKLDGEAFFNVTTDPALAPFVVVTDKFGVKVLGTSFNVKAFAGEPVSEVLLERGSIRLQTLSGESLVRLRPNQKAVFNELNDDIEISEIDAASFVLIRYNLITMSDVTIDHILTYIEKIYNVSIHMPNRNSPKHYDFNFLKTNTLNQVMDIVEYMTGEKCEIKE